MSGHRDVDESILEHAVRILSNVRRQTSELRVDILDDVPRLLVYLFERVTSEAIPEELKPFGNFRERSETLQMILDTLEQTLGLSLSHLSGVRLAKLDRRQLADALEIFDDLIGHCFRTRQQDDVTRKPTARAEESPDGRLTMSFLRSPEPTTIETCTRDQHTRNPERATRENRTRDKHTSSTPEQFQMLQDSPGYHNAETREYSANERGKLRRPCQNTVDTRSHFVGDATVRSSNTQTGIGSDVMKLLQMENQRTAQLPPILQKAAYIPRDGSPSASSTKSLTLLAKDMYRQGHEEQTNDIVHRYVNENNHRKAYAENADYTWFSPETHGVHNVARDNLAQHHKKPEHNPSLGTGKHEGQERYVPYRKDRPMAKGMKSGTPVAVRKPSVKTFSRGRQVSESVSNQKKIVPQKPSVYKPRLNKGRENPGNQARDVPLSLAGRRPSARSEYKGQGQNKAFDRGRKQSNRSVKFQRNEDNSEYEGRKATFKPHASLPVQGRKRVPSVVSTKVRKHSYTSLQESPRGLVQRSSVKRGQVSPQTTSLFSSFKLLEEFDYVRKRLKEIQQLKNEHLESIKYLDREEVRLEAVLSHVHTRSRVRDTKTPERTSRHGYHNPLGAAV